ncbi:MAG: phosphate acyltransferase PlsX [Rickettsiales bacterium]|nr:phosphate acyltransferase PlsX [Rickettsiales bacterium]
MFKKYTIALDCMGGDNAPRSVLEGAQIIAKTNPNVHFLLFGNAKKINPFLSKLHQLNSVHTLIHTEEFISAEEKPSVALRKGTNSSMRLAIDAVKDGKADVAISAGNTGALMTIAKIVLRPLPSIDRPAIVTSIPNQKKTGTVLLDMGANVECPSDVLYQFAIMGHAFARVVLKVEKPSIGILNVGSEDLKGSDAVKNAAQLLKESKVKDCFYGYVEGDDIIKGTVNVVVTDGFSGNITLKAIEGTAKLIVSIVKEGFNNSLLGKIGYLFARSPIRNAIKNIDPRLHNGAMLIGLNGVVVKSHGSTDGLGFSNAIKVAISLVENRINERITEELKVSSDDTQAAFNDS